MLVLAFSILHFAFSTGKMFHYISIQDIVESLGDEKRSVLYYFHAFTGCAQTFYGCGEITTFNTWMNYNEVTMAS